MDDPSAPPPQHGRDARAYDPPHKSFLVGCISPFMRLAEYTSRRFAIGARDVGLVGENPTCSVPALWGVRVYGPKDYDDA